MDKQTSHQLTAGQTYAVSPTASCTISSGSGTVSLPALPDSQTFFSATEATQQTSTAEQSSPVANDKTTWLSTLLHGWGIRECWAKVIAGAIIGALCAAGLLTGCRASVSQNADGSWSYRGIIIIPDNRGK